MKHNSVLSKELVNSLDIKNNGIYVDCTLGLGGHTKLIAKKNPNGIIISFDQDPYALKEAKKRLSKFKNILYIEDNFINIISVLKKLNIEKVDGVIADLGTSFYQLTNQKRGFTFKPGTKLDMRMNPKNFNSAINVLNNYSLQELTNVFEFYGDIKNAKLLSKLIVEARVRELSTSDELNNIIDIFNKNTFKKIKYNVVYQSIRIEVNDEINSIIKLITDSVKILKKNGTLIAITFHSLEDRIVKNEFWKLKQDIEITIHKNIEKYKTHKSIYVSKDEAEKNTASKSAKLRKITKLI